MAADVAGGRGARVLEGDRTDVCKGVAGECGDVYCGGDGDEGDGVGFWGVG